MCSNCYHWCFAAQRLWLMNLCISEGLSYAIAGDILRKAWLTAHQSRWWLATLPDSAGISPRTRSVWSISSLKIAPLPALGLSPLWVFEQLWLHTFVGGWKRWHGHQFPFQYMAHLWPHTPNFWVCEQLWPDTFVGGWKKTTWTPVVKPEGPQSLLLGTQLRTVVTFIFFRFSLSCKI